jgi:hypothetical protein
MSFRSDRNSFAARRAKKIHPIWQVLGWIWIFLLIIISGAAARLVSQANRRELWIGLSSDMYKYIILPVVNLFEVRLDFNTMISWIPGYPFYVDELVFFLAFIFTGLGVFSIVYAFMYSRIIPIRGPMDAPEIEAQRGLPKRRS